jgi:hypothetical protein
MITDCYYKTGKKGVKGTVTEQDYTNKTERLKYYTNITRNPRQRAAPASHDKPQESNSKGATVSQAQILSQ